MFPLGGGQVPLLSEPPFQLVGLRFGKQDATFFLFADVVVAVVGGGVVAVVVGGVAAVVGGGVAAIVGGGRVALRVAGC